MLPICIRKKTEGSELLRLKMENPETALNLFFRNLSLRTSYQKHIAIPTV
jgi:hypothetical protein